MSAREEILGRVRGALAGADRFLVTVPRGYRTDPPPANVVALFCERVADYRATVVRCTEAEVPARVAAALEGTRRVVALAQRLKIHHTPKHGSWLNVAEIELSALTRQCLDRRIDDLEILNAELTAWQNSTNADQRQVRWHFTTSDARTRLRHLYPEH